MDKYALFIGRILLYVGGAVLGLAIIAIIAGLTAELWIEASRRWRGIVRAESLILEYRQYQDEFKEWLRERKDK